MTEAHPRVRRRAPVGLLTALSLAAAPLAACNRDTDHHGASMTPVDESMRYPGAPAGSAMPQPMEASGESHSMRNKMILLGGAAALYYLYKQHQGQADSSGQPQYYLSKNGRVYYRDADHRAHWITPPAAGIRVPESEAAPYRDLQGYDNRATGRDLTSVPEAQDALDVQ
jgi:hypothetical protein